MIPNAKLKTSCILFGISILLGVIVMVCSCEGQEAEVMTQMEASRFFDGFIIRTLWKLVAVVITLSVAMLAVAYGFVRLWERIKK